MKRYYFDHASTTPVDPRVITQMVGCLGASGHFGNPASTTHGFGWDASEAVESARVAVAETIGADPRELVWTSGATEADNLALKGLYDALASQTGRHKIISLASEHKAILDPLTVLGERGAEVVILNPLPSGLVDLQALEAVLDQTTLFVTMMAVNNETGVIQPLAEIARLAHAVGALMHSDLAQAVGKIPVAVDALGLDLASLSAHKTQGPKGVGALYVRRAPHVVVAEQMHGGGHERGMRSGTLPTHQIVGMGEAFRLADLEGPADRARMTVYRQRVVAALSDLGGIRVNGEGVPHILNVTVSGVDAEPLMAAMPEIAVSTGSACNSATLEPSHVLQSMGLSRQDGLSSLRVSFGRTTSDEDVSALITALTTVIPGLRRSS